MFTFFPTEEISSIYPEGFSVFYDKKNNKYKGIMPGRHGQYPLIKANDKLMQEWCEGTLKDGENYTDKKCRKLLFEAISKDKLTCSRIKEYLKNLNEKIKCKTTDKDVDKFIKNTLMVLS